MTDRAVPNLPSRDFAATVDFYSAFGFEQSYRDEGWLILRRGAVHLEFFPFPDLEPRESSFMCSVRVGDLEELRAAIERAGVPVRATGIPRLTDIAAGTWGQRVCYLIDLDGTQLSLIEDAGS